MRRVLLIVGLIFVGALQAQQKFSVEDRIKARVYKYNPAFNGMIFASRLRSCSNYEEKVFASLTQKYKTKSLKMLVVLPENEPDTLLLNALKGSISPVLKRYTEWIYNDELFNDLNSNNIDYVRKFGNVMSYIYNKKFTSKTERIVFMNQVKPETEKNDTFYKMRGKWNVSYARYGIIYHMATDEGKIFIRQNNSTVIRIPDTRNGREESIDLKPLIYSVRQQFFTDHNLRVSPEELPSGDGLEVQLLDFRVDDTFYVAEILIKNPKQVKRVMPRNTLLGAVFSNKMELLNWFFPPRNNIYSQNIKLSDMAQGKFLFEVLPPCYNQDGSKTYLFEAEVLENKLNIYDTIRSLSIPKDVYNKYSSLGDYTVPIFKSLTTKHNQKLYWVSTFPLIFMENNKLNYRSKIFDYNPKDYLGTLSLKEKGGKLEFAHHVNHPEGIIIEKVSYNFVPIESRTFIMPKHNYKMLSNIIEHEGCHYFIGEYTKKDKIHKEHRLMEFKIN